MGGVRSFFMLLILLAWQMMRFNEAVESRRTKAAAKASTEKDEQKGIGAGSAGKRASICSSIPGAKQSAEASARADTGSW